MNEHKELYEEMLKLKVELKNCDKWMTYARERLEKIEQSVYDLEDKKYHAGFKPLLEGERSEWHH